MAAAYRSRRNQQQQDPSPTTTRPIVASSFDDEEIEESPSRSRSRSRSTNPSNPIIASTSTSSTSSSSSLATKAIRASSAHMDSSLSSAYLLSPPSPSPSSSKPYYDLNQSNHGFWASLSRKAKSLLDHPNVQSTLSATPTPATPATPTQYHSSDSSESHHRKSDNQFDIPTTLGHHKGHKGLGAIASSLSSIGGAIGNAFEEGLSNRTADIIQETRKLHISKKDVKDKDAIYSTRHQPSLQTQMQPQLQTDQHIQLKASRDVAMAMAAKAKLLLRELKTVKADLAFAKDRCAQLEEENRILRENRDKGSNLEDDDMIRLQLETLLAEKARLAQENSVYARENRFLREIVEYHQLTMQDVVYLNEGTEEVTEVHPIRVPSVSLQVNPHVFPVPMPPAEFIEVSKNAAIQGSDSVNLVEDSKSRSIPSA